ncbi:MAG: hypothetical protein ACI857_001802 [Arenicella sp.]|jgi:hypothetical protein
MKQTVLIFSIILISFGCSKEKLIDVSPSLVGDWKHYSADDQWEIVFINSDGTGKVEYFRNSKLFEETKVKDWFTADNRLYLGKVTFSLQPYTVSEFPTLSPSLQIIEFDTLSMGVRYMQLNQLNYVEIN